MRRKVRFALVGVGSSGRAHAQGILDDGRGVIVAVCDPDKKRAKAVAAELGVRSVHSDVETLLASKTAFDAAVVSTPNIVHAPISVALLERGKSVYCEKPPTINAAAAQTVVKAQNSAKGVYMVGFNQRFDPWAQYVKKRIEAGKLGKIYHAQTQWHRRHWTSTFGQWFTDKEASGGGPLIDIGIHRLDQTLWLLGFPEALSVSGVTYDRLARAESRRIKKSCTVEDFSVALIKLAGGISLLLQASYLSYLPQGASEMSTLLMGTKCGYLQSGHLLRIMTNGTSGATDTIIRHYDVPRMTAVEHFIDCVQGGKQPMCTAEQGWTVMRILDAIYESARTGQEVLLDEKQAAANDVARRA